MLFRSYMIDQMNSDYVKFARSGGLTEGEIFTRHILKNAAIPIIQGIPAAVLGALTGAIITERVYVVPGIGNLLTEAINKYDNGVIVGGTLFYAILTVTSLILGDVLMAMVDPRISFSTKGFGPHTCSRIRPNIHTANILKNKWVNPPCMNI